jgi:hypothetical protein
MYKSIMAAAAAVALLSGAAMAQEESSTTTTSVTPAAPVAGPVGQSTTRSQTIEPNGAVVDKSRTVDRYGNATSGSSSTTVEQPNGVDRTTTTHSVDNGMTDTSRTTTTTNVPQ